MKNSSAGVEGHAFESCDSLDEAIYWIARLGELLGNREQEPRLKTLWRGMSKLQHLIEGAQRAANI